jgi:hypothetical protein
MEIISRQSPTREVRDDRSPASRQHARSILRRSRAKPGWIVRGGESPRCSVIVSRAVFPRAGKPLTSGPDPVSVGYPDRATHPHEQPSGISRT